MLYDGPDKLEISVKIQARNYNNMLYTRVKSKPIIQV
jgi:hypothetical protein